MVDHDWDASVTIRSRGRAVRVDKQVSKPEISDLPPLPVQLVAAHVSPSHFVFNTKIRLDGHGLAFLH